MNFALAHVNQPTLIGEKLREMITSVELNDEYSLLDTRLANELRSLDVKPLKVETIPSHFDDELSGDAYNDRAIFNSDGSVDVVSYKGEGEASFETVEEYNNWLVERQEIPHDYDDDYDLPN